MTARSPLRDLYPAVRRAKRTPARPIPEPPSGGPVAANPKINFLSINQSIN